MRNFAVSNDFYLGTGLVAPGQERVLSRGTDELVEACRKLDAGRLYQQELDRTFDAAAQRILCEDNAPAAPGRAGCRAERRDYRAGQGGIARPGG